MSDILTNHVYDNYLRISIGTDEEMDKFTEFLTNYIQER